MFRVFQSVRGLADDSVTRLDKIEDLALEMRNYEFNIQVANIEQHKLLHDFKGKVKDISFHVLKSFPRMNKQS